MKLLSFSVENYRSITSARQIDLQDSTVLIGPNNEGKSNILRALSAGMFALTRVRGGKIPVGARAAARNDGDLTRIFDWSRDFPITLQKKKGAKTTNITLEFQLSPDEINEFKAEINSNLNGTIPVLIILSETGVEVKIVKQGRGSATLNAKSGQISRFLADRIQFQYIPAVRTAQHATRIVESLISEELAAIEDDPEYKAAMSTIKELQKPILERFSAKTTQTLKSFLPGTRAVTFSVSEEKRYNALRQAIDIEVDDGNITALEAKGDGVQSLVALGLRRHLLEEKREKRTYIFAVEEPEAHLHPDAIHSLRAVLQDVSRVDQLLITTHSGLLANRTPIASNIIVRKSRATPARNLAEIRSALGIRSHDNLINSEVVLLVEGDDDKLAMRGVIAQKSIGLKDALAGGRLILESLDGAGSLGAKIGLYKNILCQVHCFIDHDEAGRTALEKACKAGLVGDADFNFALLTGKSDSEFEDLLEADIYSEAVLDRFGVNVKSIKPRNRKAKWSSRMADVFQQAGKPFDDAIKQRLKFVVAECVAANPATAIAMHCSTVIDSLVESLEQKLNSTAS